MKTKTILIVLIAATLCACSNPDVEKLPILGIRKPVQVTADGKTTIDTIYKTIPKFSFINQDSTVVTDHDFDGKIYVADFFFTSCPDVCPIIQRNMLKVYQKYSTNGQVKLVSHTIDTVHDRPWKLKQYANKLGVAGTQWEFLWGSKKSIYSLAKNDYQVSVDDDTKGPGGFAHEGFLVLVDEQKRMRGVYDGTSDEQVAKLMKDMDTLLLEYSK